jgi:hypothetical protein
MAYLIDRIKSSLSTQGYNPRTSASRQWLKSKITQLRPNAASLMRDRERLRDNTIIGKMYFFFYDAKMKDALPYFDRFPLVIPIEQYRNGFLGLNLHYIHPKDRILLLDKLSDTATNKKYDERTKLKISYDYLLAASSIFEAKPCLKSYLYTNISSRFLEIKADEWDIAALLPVENFNASTSKVYSESRKKY